MAVAIEVLLEAGFRSVEHAIRLQSHSDLVCGLLLVRVDAPGGVAAIGVMPGDLIATVSLFFFFNDTATTEIYTLSLHDALPIWTIGGAVGIKEVVVANLGQAGRAE